MYYARQCCCNFWLHKTTCLRPIPKASAICLLHNQIGNTLQEIEVCNSLDCAASLLPHPLSSKGCCISQRICLTWIAFPQLPMVTMCGASALYQVRAYTVRSKYMHHCSDCVDQHPHPTPAPRNCCSIFLYKLHRALQVGR